MALPASLCPAPLGDVEHAGPFSPGRGALDIADQQVDPLQLVAELLPLDAGERAKLLPSQRGQQGDDLERM